MLFYSTELCNLPTHVESRGKFYAPFSCQVYIPKCLKVHEWRRAAIAIFIALAMRDPNLANTKGKVLEWEEVEISSALSSKVVIADTLMQSPYTRTSWLNISKGLSSGSWALDRGIHRLWSCLQLLLQLSHLQLTRQSLPKSNILVLIILNLSFKNSIEINRICYWSLHRHVWPMTRIPED